MKTKKHFCFILVLLLLLFTPAAANSYAADSLNTDKIYYAVEINGVVCGYSEYSEFLTEKEGRQIIEQEGTVFVMLSLLGSEFNTELKLKALLDPETKKNIYANIGIKQGSTNINIELILTGNKALIKSPMNPKPKEIELTPEIAVGSDEVFNRIKRDIYEGGKNEVSYDILEMIEGEVQRSTFKKLREEEIELQGKKLNTIVIEQVNNKTGLKTTQWFCKDYNYFVMFQVLNRKIYLSDQNIIDKIKVANMDQNIFTKTNVSISDIQSISYMKINAVIEPTGISLTEAELNVPGQKFTGRVADNHVEGIFEIEHKKYDGSNAPPFPPEFKDASLEEHLSAGGRYESDDPVLVEKAKEITEGSENSWDAAVRLSKWVAENIHYAIPGGGTPRKTYDTRSGECGAHSFLLASFCRAVRIPARVVWGAMYAPNFGGGFGQHGWNEIYMGDAGWIPVDATAFETDYVDAGHIRITHYQSAASMFNGKKFEILDYKLNKKEIETAAAKYSAFFGKYVNIPSGRTFEILEKEGNLSVNIPGQMVLPFSEPDETGRWYCKLSPRLYLVFEKNENKEIDKFIFHEIVVMTKLPPAEELHGGVPDTLKKFMGNYNFAAANLEFKIFYMDGTIAVFDPSKKDTTKLRYHNEKEGWMDEDTKNMVYFESDSKGEIASLRIDAGTHFVKGELACDIIEKIIREESIDKGLIKYRELKSESTPKVIFTEASFNALGYKFLNEGKNKEAIEIFKINAEANPESFNVYDSLGEACMKSGDKVLAIKNYEKSLELNPQNENAKKMLDNLKSGK